MRVGNDIENIVVKLNHNRSIFGKIVGVSGKTWEDWTGTQTEQ